MKNVQDALVNVLRGAKEICKGRGEKKKQVLGQDIIDHLPKTHPESYRKVFHTEEESKEEDEVDEGEEGEEEEEVDEGEEGEEEEEVDEGEEGEEEEEVDEGEEGEEEEEVDEGEEGEEEEGFIGREEGEEEEEVDEGEEGEEEEEVDEGEEFDILRNFKTNLNRTTSLDRNITGNTVTNMSDLDEEDQLSSTTKVLKTRGILTISIEENGDQMVGGKETQTIRTPMRGGGTLRKWPRRTSRNDGSNQSSKSMIHADLHCGSTFFFASSNVRSGWLTLGVSLFFRNGI